MAIWLDQSQQEPFNGILVVMNPTGMGDLSIDEREVVSLAVKKAIAEGLAVVRMYDKGVEKAPDWMDDIENHCFGRTPSFMGCKKSCPITSKMANDLLLQFNNSENLVRYVGLYEKDQKVVFAPLTEVRA